MLQGDHPRVYKRIIESGADLIVVDYLNSFYTHLETGNIDTPPPRVPKNAECL
jgi:hypothetical protein